jgi:hypothetical protein
MGREIVTQIVINAPASRLWQILCDFQAYPGWNPFIREVSGELKEGERLAVKLHLPGKASWRVRPKVTRVREAHELAWHGRLLVPGLLDGEHAFLLIPLDEKRTQLVQRKRFTGMLPAVAWPVIRRNTRRGFLLMNAALKSFIETQQHA